MYEKQLDEKEGLTLITQMINEAKSNYSRGGSFYFLMWGWVVMLANFGHYILEVYVSYPHPYIVWLITIPGAVVTVVYGFRQRKRAQVVSHLDRLYGQVWLAVGCAVVVTLLYMPRLSFNHNAVILLFAGMGTYISGQMLRFKPLMLGAIALGVASIVAFNVSVINQFLVAGFGVLFGYLIPGYILKSREK